MNQTLNGNGARVDESTLVETLARHRVILERIDAAVAAQNGRVRRLEDWKWMMAGGLMVVTFLMGSGVVTAIALLALNQ